MTFRTPTLRDLSDALVQSRLEPDWTRLPAGYLFEPATSKPITLIYNGLQVGQRLAFRLRANPTKRLPILIENRTGKERGKRIELRREEDQLAWLARKAGEHGFRLRGARVQPEQKIIGERLSKRLTFGAVVFEGELEITDASQFRQALSSGIGSGKAYGFGLLSIAPSASK